VKEASTIEDCRRLCLSLHGCHYLSFSAFEELCFVMEQHHAFTRHSGFISEFLSAQPPATAGASGEL
jgi:hypothetical protein